MDTTPLVSLIVPTLNAEHLIEACLRSIATQTYNNIEVIVVDGFSLDNTVTIAQRYARVYKYGPDQTKGRVFGAPAQRNFGVQHSRGEYVYYVDADMEL